LIAINKEIKRNYPKCPNCAASSFKKEKAIEVGNIFKLKTKYSQPFNLVFRDKDGKEKLVEMGCYGIGLDRLMGTIVEVHHDDKGIIWPEEVAPFKFHLLQLDRQTKTRSLARRIYKEFSCFGDEILFDDRENKSAAEKLIDSDLLGIPYKIIVSQRNLDKKVIEIKERKTGRSKFLRLSEVKKFYLSNL
jgi:prolyl-tRNA synthetase